MNQVSKKTIIFLLGLIIGAFSLAVVFRFNPLFAYHVMFPSNTHDNADAMYEKHCNDIFALYVDRRIARAEAKIEIAGDDEERWVQMSDLAVLYVDEGRVTEATHYAHQLTTMAEQYKSSWNYANAIHSAHTALGRIAFRRGDISDAAFHLQESVKVEGSPQLNNFGPRLILADELYHAGKTTDVVEFLESSRKFFDDDLQILIWLDRIGKRKDPLFQAKCLE